MERSRAVIFLLTLLIILPTCKARYALSNEGEFPYPVDEWILSTPEAENMSSSHLDEMLDFIESNSLSINSILITRHGKIVLEQYYDFYDENTTVNIFSCTKTVTAMVIGIAIDKGYIENTSIKVLSFFEDRVIRNLDERKESITIEDLLTMRAGFDWNDNSDAGMSEYNEMLRSDDWVQFVLDRPMEYEPGLVFNYNSGASLLLSAIIQNATRMTAGEFADIHLFQPLGIANYHWRENTQGVTIGGNTLTLRARDMARLGYLLLRNGLWDGTQIISSEYLIEATSTHTLANDHLGYGYQIWTRDSLGVFQAMGYAGQYIFVAPEYDLVVTFSATSGWRNTAMEDWIIPSILDQSTENTLDLLMPIIVTGLVSIPIAVAAIHYMRLKKI